MSAPLTHDSAMNPVLGAGDMIDGKYRIAGSIGRGAWGHVYEGFHERIERTVAIKVMHIEYAENAEMRERFEREARAATRIDSDHVVHVFDLGFLPDTRPYIVMEFLRGEDLGKRIHREGAIGVESVAVIGVQALRGLADAHAAGILHRDIKPDNICIVRSKHGESVKLVDFGISKVVHAGHAGHAPNSVTQTTQILGSPVYMSPEQCRGAKNLDARSDLYSLGVALYEAATGKLPYNADSFNALMFKIALEDAPEAHTIQPSIDPGFSAILKKALGRNPEDRYQTAEAFEAAIVLWGEARGIRSDDWRRISTNGARGGAPPLDSTTLSAGQRASGGGLASGPVLVPGASPAALSAPDPGEVALGRASGAAGDTPPPGGLAASQVPAKASSKRLAIGAAAAGVALLGLFAGFALRPSKGTLPRSADPVASSGPVVSTATATASAPEIAGGETNPTASASEGEPERPLTPPPPGSAGARATSSAVAASRLRPTGAKDAGVAPVASVGVPPPPATPSAAASQKPGAVVDGRTIRTEF